MNLFDVYPLYDITPVKGKGIHVYDDKNVEYLDLYGGHAVISIGHSHPNYVQKIQEQVANLGFYSNAIQNPLQKELATKLGELSGCDDYNLFLVNSGAEANENALKVASFVTNKSRVIAFKHSFHGRTSAAVAATDNPKIHAPLNQQQSVTFVALEDEETIEAELKKGDVCAVIIEGIQGVGGLDVPTEHYLSYLSKKCKEHGALLILDEIQSGYGRTGKFFAYQYADINPDIITTAKGMGNGFPLGGVLIHSSIKAAYGMLGTTFGGNHLACAAGISVLDTLKDEKLMENVLQVSEYLVHELSFIPKVKSIKGKGLMLGITFDFPIKEIRAQLLHEHHIFTGASSNPNLLRILPPLCITKEQFDPFLLALKEILS
ncbi:MAG: aminotransferase class III-fold pyridoxal phosphate-dependent enzyme [Cyclobacteriaceae bacterium]|nr:aminotransferase class III-fold pyridoxal phosphate-dependent enzyme [Cyclobacteriaceae bacterium]